MTLQNLKQKYVGKSTKDMGRLLSLEQDRISKICTATFSTDDSSKMYYDRSSVGAMKNFLYVNL